MTRYRHGMTGTRAHNIWLGMLDRCRNDRTGRYGKRGVKVCDRWRVFENFYADMGEPPSDQHSIDRIDVNGHYSPENCRWATRTEQARNTTRNTILEHDGKRRTIAEWSVITGIGEPTICHRLYVSKWSVSNALTKPPLRKLPHAKPWKLLGMSRSSWYRAGRPMP